MKKNNKIITGIISLFLVATPIFALRALAVSDTMPPSKPNGLTAMLNVGNQVFLSWHPATDNTAVTGYAIVRNNNILANTPNTSYIDISVLANTNYTYSVLAYDAAGNVSPLSSSVSINTATSSDTTLPSAPDDLLANSISQNKIKLTWTAATDNVGVTGYNIYRDNVLVATSSTNSFVNTGLTASTSYTFYIKAYDAAGNVSTSSNIITAKTLAVPTNPSNRDKDGDDDHNGDVNEHHDGDVNEHHDNGNHFGQLKAHTNHGHHFGQNKKHKKD